MNQQKMTAVPKDKVGTIVQSFIDDGANEVLSVEDPDGTWTVTATFS